jgi:hypothetical protein
MFLAAGQVTVYVDNKCIVIRYTSRCLGRLRTFPLALLDKEKSCTRIFYFWTILDNLYFNFTVAHRNKLLAISLFNVYLRWLKTPKHVVELEHYRI